MAKHLGREREVGRRGSDEAIVNNLAPPDAAGSARGEGADEVAPSKNPTVAHPAAKVIPGRGASSIQTHRARKVGRPSVKMDSHTSAALAAYARHIGVGSLDGLILTALDAFLVARKLPGLDELDALPIDEVHGTLLREPRPD